MIERVAELLRGIAHPESGDDIVTAGIVRDVNVPNDSAIEVVLEFLKKRDPFAKSIKKQIESVLSQAFPSATITITIAEKPAEEKKAPRSTTSDIKHVVAISSGKGGVGKSTVTANIATTLNKMGYKVGILDADIYGPSMPKMFGVEDHVVEGLVRNDAEYILPAEADGIKIMSIGFFISPDDALVWRGPMANNALKQMIHQTLWEELDFLLVDLPPGTGDVHLSIISELKIDGAIVVSTPQQVAVADARRGINMFRTEGINIPILGVVENMAWFTPAELPNNKYYLFGKGGASELAKAENIALLGEVPIIQSIMESADGGKPASASNKEVQKYYSTIALNIVDNLNK